MKELNRTSPDYWRTDSDYLVSALKKYSRDDIVVDHAESLADEWLRYGYEDIEEAIAWINVGVYRPMFADDLEGALICPDDIEGVEYDNEPIGAAFVHGVITLRGISDWITVHGKAPRN